MNSDLAYGAEKRILFYVLTYIVLKGLTIISVIHMMSRIFIYFFSQKQILTTYSSCFHIIIDFLWITISGSMSMIAHVNN